MFKYLHHFCSHVRSCLCLSCGFLPSQNELFRFFTSLVNFSICSFLLFLLPSPELLHTYPLHVFACRRNMGNFICAVPVFRYILSFDGVDFPFKFSHTKASSSSIVFNELKKYTRFVVILVVVCFSQ